MPGSEVLHSPGALPLAGVGGAADGHTPSMASTRTATTRWEGSLAEGQGQVSLDSSGLGSYDVTWAARTEEPGGRTSPEELIAAAHSACLSMAFSHALAEAGHPPERLETKADVTFQPGEGITEVRITVRGTVPGLSPEEFVRAAEGTDCPVSNALGGTTITLDAALA